MIKILLLSNVHEELGRPGFRTGSYRANLIPLAAALDKTGQTECRFIASPFVASELADEIDADRLHVLDSAQLSDPAWRDILTRSYTEAAPAAAKQDFAALLDGALGGWRPDVILCWETPTVILREIYAEALVIDLMPGLFMRPPFPAMISLDPKGLYRDCWFRDVDVDGLTVPDPVLDEMTRLQQTYQAHFDSLEIPDAFAPFLNGNPLAEAQIVPLQIGAYFGWRDNIDYPDQAALVKDLLRHTPEATPTVLTHYTGAFISELLVTPETEAAYHQLHPRFIFDPAFDGLDNITQYLVPAARRVVSVSSSLGLQAKFMGKELVSPSQSHLRYIADATDLSALDQVAPRPLPHFMAGYLARTNLLRPRFTSDGAYALRVIEEMRARQQETGLEAFPDFDTIGNSAATLLEHSNLPASDRLFSGQFKGKKGSQKAKALRARSLVTDEAVEVVSFDVFDTLLCRTVASPQDVFALMQRRLKLAFADRFPPVLIDRFPDLRMGCERIIRRRLDLESGEHVQELTIADVYHQMAETVGFAPEEVETLIALEQEVELGCLVANTDTSRLFAAAGRAGKRRIIVSDFIHPTGFVEQALRQAGYDGWEKLYVSSDYGQKKHSGHLFDTVLSELGVAPEKILHLGDNPHGDIAMADAKGIQTYHVPRAPALALDLMRKAGFGANAIGKSVRLSAQLGLFANKYCATRGARDLPTSAKPTFLSTAEEAGFLMLGPPMQAFAAFILETAQAQNCSQIALFARDTYLPYKMLCGMLAARPDLDIQICYLPVSRKGVTGLDIFELSDLINVRIDDFTRKAPLQDLMGQRFGLQPEELCGPVFDFWSQGRSDEAELKVSDVPAMAIYQIAMESAAAHRDAFLTRMEEKRALFKTGLSQWGCDLSQRTLTVDFGYKGSIHTKIAHLFETPPEAAMAMSYCDKCGMPPLQSAHIFYLSNTISDGASPLPAKKLNLVLETLLNQAQGTVLGYEERFGQVHVHYDAALPNSHKKTIQEVHRGALMFEELWRTQCQIIEANTRIAPIDNMFFLEHVLLEPSPQIARVLSRLSFDNAFAGHQDHKLLDRLWLNKPNRTRDEKAKTKPKKPAKSSPGKQFALASVGLWVSMLHSEKTYQSYVKDPHGYLAKSRLGMIRKLGTKLAQ